jgi:hypothetical protein
MDEKEAKFVLNVFVTIAPADKFCVLIMPAVRLLATPMFMSVENWALMTPISAVLTYTLLKLPTTAFTPATFAVVSWSGNANVLSTAHTLLVRGDTVRNPNGWLIV